MPTNTNLTFNSDSTNTILIRQTNSIAESSK
jgi:hypothetical protein